MELTEYHYVYYSYEEYGKGYIGSRTCKCLPEEDINYFGSFKDKTFKPTQKIILKNDYTTREEAYVDEIILQEYYKVVENPHFANRAYQTSTSFSVYGTTLSEEHKRKISEARKGKSYPKREGKLYSKGKGKNHYNYDKTLSEETKKKISKATKGKKLTIDHKKKISESNKGKSKTITEKSKNSVIIRAKARTGIPGHKHSEETKRKISKATQGKVPWNKGIKNPNITGGKSPAAKKIYYDGTIYDCILNAIKITNKSYYHIKKYGTIVS